MLRTYTILAFLLCSSLAVIGQPLGFSIADGRSKVEIPIEVHNNLIVVPVILNGALPLKFIVDTGVRTSILTQKSFSDILNLPYSRKYTISGPGGEKLIDAYITNNVTLQLPGVIGRGHAMLVLEEDYLELRNYLGTDVHGILGYELFSRFIVEVNYERKVMKLMLPKKFRVKRNFQTIPIRIEDTKPYLTTPIVLQNGTQLTAKLLVDSGASHGLMLDQTSDDRIQVPTTYVSSVLGRGLGGEIRGKVGRIRTLQLGDYKIENPIVNFPDPNSYFDTLKTGNAPRNGSIGGEVLTRFTVIFDFPKELIYLKKNHSFKKSFHYNLSGLNLKAKGSRLNVYEVTGVRQESAAAKAGIQIGDIIVNVNGIPASSVDLNVLNGLFNFKPGKKINVTIDRNGERMKMDFRLTDQI
jgi:hypothetical protein